MKNCIQCSGLISDSAKFCGFCGATQGEVKAENSVQTPSAEKIQQTASPKKSASRRPNELENFSDGIYGYNKAPQRLNGGGSLAALAVIALIAAVLLLVYLAAGGLNSAENAAVSVIVPQALL